MNLTSLIEGTEIGAISEETAGLLVMDQSWDDQDWDWSSSQSWSEDQDWEEGY